MTGFRRARTDRMKVNERLPKKKEGKAAPRRLKKAKEGNEKIRHSVKLGRRQEETLLKKTEEKFIEDGSDLWWLQ